MCLEIAAEIGVDDGAVGSHCGGRTIGDLASVIEHDIGVVMGLSHHVVVLDYGRKVGDGTPAEVRGNPEVIAAYLGTKH